MEKKTKLIFSAIAIFVIVLIPILVYSSLVSSKTITAQLTVEQNSVMVNGNLVSGTIDLKEGDLIETSASGLATVILYESVVISLEENTIITLDDLERESLTVTQEKGSSWSQVTNLMGIDFYTVKTGNTVASVRGTAFYIEDDLINVGEGTVDYEIDGQKFQVIKGKAVQKINGEIKERDLSPEEIAKIRMLKVRAVDGLRKLRKLELEKHPRVVNMVKKKYDFSDEKIEEIFDSADRGEINLGDFKNQAPIKLDSLDKIIDFTEKIKELNEDSF